MSYELTLTTLGGDTLTMPVLPEKLTIESAGNQRTQTVLGLGQVLLLDGSLLHKITFESHFPSNDAPYVSDLTKKPMTCVNWILSAQKSGEALWLELSGGTLYYNQLVGIETFTFYEQGGDVGDIFYHLTLRQWKAYTATELEVSEDGTAVESPDDTRTTTSSVSGTYYTVVSGDCLWSIAKSQYGDASKWGDIYEANRDVVGANPNLIYPGQELLLP